MVAASEQEWFIFIQVDSTKYINEYDEETQGVIRKLVFEQRQKVNCVCIIRTTTFDTSLILIYRCLVILLMMNMRN